MPKVKKYNVEGSFMRCSPGFDILDFGAALKEILHFNHGGCATLETLKEDEEKIRRLLVNGYIVNTASAMYHVINPIKDVLNNIDDCVNLDDYKGE